MTRYEVEVDRGGGWTTELRRATRSEAERYALRARAPARIRCESTGLLFARVHYLDEPEGYQVADHGGDA